MRVYACSVSVENFFSLYSSVKNCGFFRSMIALKFFLYIGWRNYGAIFGSLVKDGLQFLGETSV